MNTSLLFSLIGLLLSLLLCYSPLQAQRVEQEVDILSKALRNSSGLRSSTFDLQASGRDSVPNPLGILTAYAYRTAEEALSASQDPGSVIALYQQNPYLQKYFTDASDINYWKGLADPESVKRAVLQVRSGEREKIQEQLQQFSSYSDKTIEQSAAILSAYQLPVISTAATVRNSSQQISTALQGEAASLTTTVLFGLTQWVGERAQAELMQTFLLRLQDDLGDQQLNYLFPNTYQYLDKLNVVNYKSIIANARSAFQQDLQTLSLNVSNYLFESGRVDKNDPLAYNLLLAFQVIQRAQQDLPIHEIMAYTRGALSERQFESEKQLHFNLVNSPQTPAYQNLQAGFDRAYQRIDEAFDVMLGREQALLSRLTNLVGSDMQEYQPPIQDVKRRIDALSSIDYATVFSDAEGRYLRQVKFYLDGQLDYALLRLEPDPAAFQRIFNGPAPEPSELRGVALTMIRQLLKTEPSPYRYTALRELQHFARELRQIESSIALLERIAQLQQPSALGQVSQQLQQRINREIRHWSEAGADSLQVQQHDVEALRYLRSMADSSRIHSTGTVRKQVSRMDSLNTLLDATLLKLGDTYPTLRAGSPYFQELQEQTNIADTLTLRIVGCRNALDDLQVGLTALENAGANAMLLRSFESAGMLNTVFEAGLQMLYMLATPGTEGQIDYLKPSDLTALLSKEASRDVFLGLLYQRVAGLTQSMQIDARGIANVATQTAEQLAQAGSSRQSRTYNRVQTALGLVNNILGTPLVRQSAEQEALQLKDVFGNSVIRQLPAINTEVMELYQRVDSKQYRYALDNALELVQLFNAFPEASARQRRLERKINEAEQELRALSRKSASSDAAYVNSAAPQPDDPTFARLAGKLNRYEQKLQHYDSLNYKDFRTKLFRYGHFIADIASADSVQNLSSAITTIALPRGSSQNKRLNSFSLELNAYFGGTVAHEVVLNEDRFDESFGVQSYGLFVPFGITLSKQLFGWKKSSFSLFLPIIDLGALTAYRSDTDVNEIDALPEVSFANILAPGAHLMYNFARTPFFIGAGAQYGPNVRELQIGEEVTKVQTLRFMVSLGIDVPLITLTKR